MNGRKQNKTLRVHALEIFLPTDKFRIVGSLGFIYIILSTK